MSGRDDFFEATDERFRRGERDRDRFGDNELAQPPRGRVTGASDLKDIELFQHAKKGAGVLVSKGRHGTEPQWLPLSKIEIQVTGRTGQVWNDNYRKWAPIVIVTLPEWLARDRGLL